MTHFEKMQEICKQAYGEDAPLHVGDMAYLVDETVVHIVLGADGGVYIFDRHGELTNSVTDEMDAMPEGMPYIAWCICQLYTLGTVGFRKFMGNPRKTSGN